MPHPFWALAFALLGSAILGTLGLIGGLWAEKFDQLAAFQNFLITPLTFLSGVFYSIHSLPPFWQALSHANPFFYMIDGFRYGFFGLSDVPPALSLAIVAACALLLSLARRSRCCSAAGSCVSDRGPRAGDATNLRRQALHRGSPMVTPESIRTSIAAGLPCEHVEVRGDGHHWEAVIVSAAFEGLSKVRQHQLVYGALGDRMREEIHALSMTTLTPAQWAAARALR